MAHWVQVIAIKTDNKSSWRSTWEHRVRTDAWKVPSDLHMCAVACACAYPCKHTPTHDRQINVCFLFNSKNGTEWPSFPPWGFHESEKLNSCHGRGEQRMLGHPAQEEL